MNPGFPVTETQSYRLKCPITISHEVGLFDWVKFIVPSARVWLGEMPMLWTWDRLLVAPASEAQDRKWHVI